ncbi:MAG: 50S ribosomal protein L23 [Candidatus Nealsonbacteria bacterium]|nr:50S ribosomal protein L23 [Candidatus Nealsonbacteria bacterium]
MSFLDKFKKNKKEALKKPWKEKKAKKKTEKKPAKIPEKKEVEKKPEKKEVKIEEPKIKIKKITRGEERWILKGPHVTEKATDLVAKNKYVFKVYSRANKIEIKKAVQDLYGIDVLTVRIINIPARKRRLGRHEGWQKGYKKAIIKVKEGQKIEILPR